MSNRNQNSPFLLLIIGGTLLVICICVVLILAGTALYAASPTTAVTTQSTTANEPPAGLAQAPDERFLPYPEGPPPTPPTNDLPGQPPPHFHLSVVDSVQAGSGASTAGVQVGDTIVAIDNQALLSPNELIATLQTYQAGDEITLLIRRGQETLILTATLSHFPDEPERPFLGISLMPATTFTHPPIPRMDPSG